MRPDALRGSLTGLDKAFTGMLFLGDITSLPKVAAVSTSAAIGNAQLALNNLIGTSSVNVSLVLFGAGSMALVIAAVPALWIASGSSTGTYGKWWRRAAERGRRGGDDEPSPYSDWPLRILLATSAIAGAVILVSGVALATAANVVSARTGSARR